MTRDGNPLEGGGSSNPEHGAGDPNRSMPPYPADFVVPDDLSGLVEPRDDGPETSDVYDVDASTGDAPDVYANPVDASGCVDWRGSRGTVSSPDSDPSAGDGSVASDHEPKSQPKNRRWVRPAGVALAVIAATSLLGGSGMLGRDAPETQSGDETPEDVSDDSSSTIEEDLTPSTTIEVEMPVESTIDSNNMGGESTTTPTTSAQNTTTTTAPSTTTSTPPGPPTTVAPSTSESAGDDTGILDDYLEGANQGGSTDAEAETSGGLLDRYLEKHPGDADQADQDMSESESDDESLEGDVDERIYSLEFGSDSSNNGFENLIEQHIREFNNIPEDATQADIDDMAARAYQALAITCDDAFQKLADDGFVHQSPEGDWRVTAPGEIPASYELTQTFMLYADQPEQIPTWEEIAEMRIETEENDDSSPEAENTEEAPATQEEAPADEQPDMEETPELTDSNSIPVADGAGFTQALEDMANDAGYDLTGEFTDDETADGDSEADALYGVYDQLESDILDLVGEDAVYEMPAAQASEEDPFDYGIRAAALVEVNGVNRLPVDPDFIRAAHALMQKAQDAQLDEDDASEDE